MSKLHLLTAVAASALMVSAASAAPTLIPLTGFGGADGWLAPGEGGYGFLGTGNNERGMAYGNGHVYLVSRTGGNFVRILDPNTGADVGSLSVPGGTVTGGTFAINTIGIGGDGAIYVNNLTTQTTTSPFKVYRWATEASAPTVAYSGNGGLAASRLGDSMAIIGSGASTLIAAGYGNAPAVAGNNGYAIVDPTAATATAVGFVGTPPNAGDYRLGITFTDSSHVLGTQSSSLYRYSSFSGSTGTLLGSPAIPDPAGATADRLLAYTTVGSMAVLAVQSIGDSHVSIYDVTNPAAPIYLVSGNNTSGSLASNGNGTGQLAWNVTDSAHATLYAMSTNQGIQAFTFEVPEPASMSLIAIGALGMLRRRK